MTKIDPLIRVSIARNADDSSEVMSPETAQDRPQSGLCRVARGSEDGTRKTLDTRDAGYFYPLCCLRCQSV